MAKPDGSSFSDHVGTWYVESLDHGDTFGVPLSINTVGNDMHFAVGEHDLKLVSMHISNALGFWEHVSVILLCEDARGVGASPTLFISDTWARRPRHNKR